MGTRKISAVFGLMLAVCAAAGGAGLRGMLVSTALAQEYAGPLLPHKGGQVDYAFSNRYGPDAEARVTFTAVTPEALSVAYASTRGLNVARDISMADRQTSNTYVLGYSDRMPRSIPNSTSLGISGATLLALRDTGQAPIRLIYDEKLAAIDGQLQLVQKDIKLPILIESQVQTVPVVHARGTFGKDKQTGTGDFYFVDNKNNPMLIQSTIKLSWENDPRTERIVRVAAGASLKSAMEQSLATLRKYDLYGIHFDFDKATMRPDSAALINDIAQTLKNNPTWTLQINGHTDSIGDATYNQTLSAARAKSVANAIVKQGIAADRLQTGGLGATQPKADNKTLQGRALNRRVELKRTDR